MPDHICRWRPASRSQSCGARRFPGGRTTSAPGRHGARWLQRLLGDPLPGIRCVLPARAALLMGAVYRQQLSAAVTLCRSPAEFMSPRYRRPSCTISRSPGTAVQRRRSCPRGDKEPTRSCQPVRVHVTLAYYLETDAQVHANMSGAHVRGIAGCRYKQLAAAFSSNDGDAVNLGRWAGFQRSIHLTELVKGQPNAQLALSSLPSPQAVASASTDLLGGYETPKDAIMTCRSSQQVLNILSAATQASQAVWRRPVRHQQSRQQKRRRSLCWTC